MILSLVLKFLSTKYDSTTTKQKAETKTPALPVIDRNAVINELMTLYSAFRIRVAKQVQAKQAERTWTTQTESKVSVNADGSYVIKNSDGKIIKTGDALRRLKEYRYDENSGELLVKKFGVWNKLIGELCDDGTLISCGNDGETHELLDGTVIYISVSSRSLIAHNEHTDEDIALTLKGTLSHRFKRDGADVFDLYSNGALFAESFNNLAS